NPGICEYPLATNLALKRLACPGTSFKTYTHLHPIIFLFNGLSTKFHVLFSVNELNSFCIAIFHSLEFELFMASLNVNGTVSHSTISILSSFDLLNVVLTRLHKNFT